MGTHKVIVSKHASKERRQLLERCKLCLARAGEPCLSLDDQFPYRCPEDGCTQLYRTAHEALSCTMHG